MTKLDPCPHCGQTPDLFEGTNGWVVRCSTCYSLIASGMSDADAAEDWNEIAEMYEVEERKNFDPDA